MADRIQLRRDIEANWAAVNPILMEGEIGLETDTNRAKLGNGIDQWLDLPYTGIAGPQGPIGPTGPEGPQGPQGDTGADSTVPGPTGPEGPEGPEGPIGPQGDIGPTGPQGEQGERGDTGDPGLDGTDGTAATVDAGTTTTLPPGSQATVVNVGDTTTAVFDFGIPEGLQGEQGVPGPEGPPGPGFTIIGSATVAEINALNTGNLRTGDGYAMLDAGTIIIGIQPLDVLEGDIIVWTFGGYFINVGKVEIDIPPGTTTGNTIRWDGANWSQTSDLVILPSGNVGIGTDTPDRRLHIASASSETVVKLTDSSTGVLEMLASGANAIVRSVGAGNMFVDSDSEVLLRAGSPRVTVVRVTETTAAITGNLSATGSFSAASGAFTGSVNASNVAATGATSVFVKDNGTNYATGSIECRSLAGDVYLGLHASGASAVALKHFRGGNVLSIVGTSDAAVVDVRGIVNGLAAGAGRLQVVAALPGTPDANTIYFVTG